MDGTELAERLPTANPQLRVLLNSGYTEEAVHDTAGVAGDAAVLAKPFSRAALLETVRQVLSAGVAR